MDKLPYKQEGVAITCRSFAEYCRMFVLNEKLLKSGEILDIASGAASFTAEAESFGCHAFAADPRYALPPEELLKVAERGIDESTQKLSRIQGQFNWSYYGSIDRHRDNRDSSLRLFIKHYIEDQQNQHPCYIPAQLPGLPFADNKFSLILCSHFLFLYEDQFDYEFHLTSIIEMIRVCRPGGEIRIYPLVTLNFNPYPDLDRIISRCAREGIESDYILSELPFIPDSRYLLRLRKIGISNK